MIEIDVKQLPRYLPLLAALLVTVITFIILVIVDNFFVTHGVNLFFGWSILFSVIIFWVVYFSFRETLKRSQVRVYSEIVFMVTPLMDDPSLNNSKVHEYAERLDIAFQGLDYWIKLSEDDYLRWSEVKEILDEREEALKLVEKCLYLNPMNEHAFWKLIYHLRFLGKEAKAIKYLDLFSVIKEPGVKNLWKALVYELRYPKEAKLFFKQSMHEEINTDSLNLELLNDYLKTLANSFEDPVKLMRHKDIFSSNLGEYWDFLTTTFPKTTILEKYYILEKITEKFGTEWLGKKRRFS